MPDFKEDGKDEKQLMETFEEGRLRIKKKKRGLKGKKKKIQTDQDRKKEMKLEKIKTKKSKGELIVENDASGKPILAQEFRQQTPIEESNDGKDDGVLNNEK